jgi:molybdate transport system substrate-binding protein
MADGATLRILSGGAANGLVDALRERFRAATGLGIDGDFGPVGGMRDRVVAGEAVDLVILTRAIIDDLGRLDLVDPSSAADIGAVATGVAVAAGAERPDVSTPDALRSALAGASALFTADTRPSTAGAHVARMLAVLGLPADLDGRLRTFPAGQTAMAELARSGDTRALGCTQATEIVNTPGVALVGALPPPHALSTVYTAAVARSAARPDAARALAALLTADAGGAERERAGFSAEGAAG